MGCFLGGIHDSSRKLLCPFYIWLPSPSTSAGLTRQTNPRPGPQHLGPDTAEAAGPEVDPETLTTAGLRPLMLQKGFTKRVV